MAKGKYCYDYPRPAVTVDVAVFQIIFDQFLVLMIRRKKEPFVGEWALPGGFVEETESFEDGAKRELREETGLLTQNPLTFVGNYGKPGRDPRGWTISIAHVTTIRLPIERVKGGDDASEAAFVAFRDIPEKLAFDHADIIRDAHATLKPMIEAGPTGVLLLPPRFTMPHVEGLIRAANSSIDPADWLKQRLDDGSVVPAGKAGKFFKEARPGAKR